MVNQKQTSDLDQFQKFAESLEAARKMQQDWITYGLDFVEHYVEDLEGDWLENWGKDEENLALESLTAFLKSDEPLAVRVREVLGTRSIWEFAIEVDRIYQTCPKDEWRDAGGKALAGSIGSGKFSRQSSDEDPEIELQDLAESLIEKLAEIWRESEQN
jgi:hypothetical protein